MNTKYYDVIVSGAGPAGICAAVAAARQGARVALIERYGVIGGNLTAGYVGPILGSVSKNTMRDEVCAILGVKDNDWIGEHGNAHDFEEAKLTLAEFVAREKNVNVFLQCCVSDVIRDGKVVKGIKCASNEGTLCFEAAVTIDCTGDAIVSFLAGAKIEKGRAYGLMQPVTLEYTIDGVDESKGIICIGDVDNVQLNGECFLDWCKKKADEGKLPRMLAAVRLHPSVRPGCRQVNTTQVNRVDITSVSSIFTADLELRQQIRLLTQFLKENLPGYENCRVIGSGTTTGVRESRRVMGDYVIDADEMAEGCRFADVVVLARELNLKQVRKIYDAIQEQQIKGPMGELVRIEMFCHGALCMAVSGKCYLSLNELNASANRGACMQVCRRAYTVKDKESDIELEVDNQYIMSPKDLKTIHFMD